MLKATSRDNVSVKGVDPLTVARLTLSELPSLKYTLFVGSETSKSNGAPAGMGSEGSTPCKLIVPLSATSIILSVATTCCVLESIST